MNIQDLNKRFRSYFGFNVPLDKASLWLRDPDKIKIDIIKLDTELAKRDSDYDPEKCKYKDQENISISKYIRIKFGDEAVKFVKANI